MQLLDYSQKGTRPSHCLHEHKYQYNYQLNSIKHYSVESAIYFNVAAILKHHPIHLIYELEIYGIQYNFCTYCRSFQQVVRL